LAGNADIRVTSWVEVQQELFFESWNDGLQRFRSPYVFRGLSDASYGLKTSLLRLEGPFAKLEQHILRNFRKYAQGICGGFASFWHLLSVAQHHRLPTRLLDWTYSPYVALHFATANLDKSDQDGVIWMVNFRKTHSLLPAPLQALLHDEGAEVFTVELLAGLTPSRDTSGPSAVESSFHAVIQSLKDFDSLAGEEEFLLFMEPPSVDERIVNQFALFSVMPNPERVVDDWLLRFPDLYRRVVIPAELKWELRDKLDQSNITERVLFPGLDGLSDWLRRHYSPRRRGERG